MRTRLWALLAIPAIILAGCAKGEPLSGATQAVGHEDINPQPRGTLRNGGTLRLAMADMPNNFNPDEVDGTTVDVENIAGGVLPSLFVATADGGVAVDPDYLTSAVLTSTSPQVVTYTINPRAHWDNGDPITWKDFASYWKASNGTNHAYQTSGSMGYSSIGSVTRGVNDQQVVVKFSTPYSEWQELFNPLTPPSLTSTPAAFNGAWRNTMPVSAGPFRVLSADPTTATVVLARNPTWWGTPPKLSQLTFTKYDSGAESDALANNELDECDIIPDLNSVRRAQNVAGVSVRAAPSRTYTHITLNGSSGGLLADLKLRQAVAQGVNRQEMTDRIMDRIVTNPQSDGNHIYLPGSKEYQDNSTVLPYDPAQSQRTLDQLGWIRHGATRSKNGKPLTLRMVYNLDSPMYLEVARTMQDEMAAIGVTVTLQGYSFTALDTALNTGDFDMAVFSWAGTPSPFSSATAIYGSPVNGSVQENYGRVFDPQIDALFRQGSVELDPVKRAQIGNQLDRLVWAEAHSIVLYSWPGLSATRNDLGNFGAFGFAETDLIDAGFLKS